MGADPTSASDSVVESAEVPESDGAPHDGGALRVRNPITPASAITLLTYLRYITGTVCILSVRDRK
jgi:hypothetical protein